MVLRLFPALVLVSVVGCGSSSTMPAPELRAVGPNEWYFGSTQAVEIHGAGFSVDVVTHLKKSTPRVDADFIVELGGVTLDDVRWGNNSLITAVAPPTLPEGTHDMIVRTPDGRAATLVDAIRVIDLGAQQTASRATFSATDTVATRLLVPPVIPDRSILFFNIAHASENPQDGQVSGQIAADGRSVIFERALATNGVSIEIAFTVVELDGISVQRGAAPRTQSLEVVTFPRAVDPARSFILISLRIGGVNYNANDWIRAKITGPTTFELDGVFDGDNPIVEWQLVELDPGRAGTVQTGDKTLGGGSTTESIGTAPRDESLLFFTHRVSSGVLASNAVRGQISADDELQFDRDASQGSVDITWYVWTWSALTVAHGTTHFAANEATAVELLSTCLPNASVAFSFLPALMRQGKSPEPTDRVGQAWFTSTLDSSGCSLTLHRGDTGQPADAAWSVARLP